MSITSRMLLVAILPALFVTLFLSAYFVINRVSDIEITELQRARTLSNSMALASEFGIASQNRNLLKGVAQSALSIPTVKEIRFYSIDGLLLERDINENADRQQLSTLSQFFRPWVSSAALENVITVPVYRTDLSQFDDPLFDLSSAEQGNQDDVSDAAFIADMAMLEAPIGSLQLRLDLSAVYQKQVEIIARAMVIVLVTLLFLFAGAYCLAQSVSVPIRELTESVGLLARKQFGSVPRIHAGGELGVLSEGVSFLSQELQSFHQKLTEATDIATRDLQVALDVLEQKNIELEAARHSAESASAFKSEFLANMSHEIRTPMNAIVGTLSLLTLTPLNRDQIEHLSHVEQSSQTLLSLIDEILDISKIESGNFELENIDTDLVQLLHGLSSTLSNQAASRGIELFVSSVPQEQVRYVRSDPLRLKQVLSNLVHNALKFTHDGHVVLDLTVLEHNETEVSMVFSVQDTGIGIPPEKINTLFSAFTQVDMSTTRNYGGSGLGLHICKSIVSLMDGELNLSSTVGIGSQFDVILTLPLASGKFADRRTQFPMDSSHLAIDPVSAPSNHEEVLLCYEETYQPFELFNRIALEQAGFCLDRAEQGDASGAPILINVSNKYLAAPESVKSLRIGRERQQIAMVGQITPTIKELLFEAGFDGYAVRTPLPNLLRSRIQRALDGHSFRASEQLTTRDLNATVVVNPIKVLAVDDQELNLRLLKQFFDYLNVEISTAGSSSEGLLLAESTKFDLIVLDIHMPGRDGFFTVGKIREIGQINRTTPIVAITADAFRSTREKALNSGFDSLLTKPITIDRVSDLLNEWAHRLSAHTDDRLSFAAQDAQIDVEHVAVDAGQMSAVSTTQRGAEAAIDQIGGQVTEHKTVRRRSTLAGRVQNLASTAPVEIAEAHVDMVSIEACAEAVMGNLDWARNALASYAKDIPELIADLDTAKANRDRQQLFYAAHSIKGVSQVCRILPVATLAHEVETASKDKDWKLLTADIARLAVLLELAGEQCLSILRQSQADVVDQI